MKVLEPFGGINRKATVDKLKKALYALKPAPPRWNYKIHGFLESIGFNCSTWDHSVCLRQTKREAGPHNDCTLCRRIVDIGNEHKKPACIKMGLTKLLEVKDLGKAKIILPPEIQHGRKVVTFGFHNLNMHLTVLARFGMDVRGLVDTSMEDCEDLETIAAGCAHNVRRTSSFPYFQALVVLCIWLTLGQILPLLLETSDSSE